MTESYQASPIIPVIDERLGYQASAPADHKVKVDKYNDMLEDIYQREVELAKIKSALVDMRSEIADEARVLNGTKDEDEDKDEKEEEGEQLSDSNSEKGKKEKKHYKSKPKGKGQYNRRSKMVDSELDAEWDYKLELMSIKRERRTSDASEKEVEMVPLRAQLVTMEPPRTRTLHSKRSFGKYPKMVDSPAYDASEEDNDPLTDDAHSATSVPIAMSRHSNTTTTTRPSHTKPSPAFRGKHHLAHNLVSDSDAGVDSPTYDGDVESSTTAGADTPASHKVVYHHHHHSTSSVSTLNTPITTTTFNTPPNTTPSTEPTNPTSPVIRATNPDSNHPVFISPPTNNNLPPQTVADEPAVAAPSIAAFNPAALTPEDIQSFLANAIAGEPGRNYKINLPPVGRPVRIYADGVYDLFHFGHALQLRQAKLAFPSVHLLVGVNSDEQVAAHKGRTVMIHAERLEAARHCRWVDEIVAEAPWIIGEDFIKKYEIDYVAHDEDAYASAGHDDVYSYAKSQGKFIPTRRTPGVSTSELLERIVSGYRNRVFDEKLTKMGHAELRAEGSDYDESRHASQRASRSTSPTHSNKAASR